LNAFLLQTLHFRRNIFYRVAQSNRGQPHNAPFVAHAPLELSSNYFANGRPLDLKLSTHRIALRRNTNMDKEKVFDCPGFLKPPSL
jgi:hypothetical protein